MGHRLLALFLFILAIILIFCPPFIKFLGNHEILGISLGIISFMASLYFFQTEHNKKK